MAVRNSLESDTPEHVCREVVLDSYEERNAVIDIFNAAFGVVELADIANVGCEFEHVRKTIVQTKSYAPSRVRLKAINFVEELHAASETDFEVVKDVVGRSECHDRKLRKTRIASLFVYLVLSRLSGCGRLFQLERGIASFVVVVAVHYADFRAHREVEVFDRRKVERHFNVAEVFIFAVSEVNFIELAEPLRLDASDVADGVCRRHSRLLVHSVRFVRVLGIRHERHDFEPFDWEKLEPRSYAGDVRESEAFVSADAVERSKPLPRSVSEVAAKSRVAITEFTGSKPDPIPRLYPHVGVVANHAV